MRKRLPILIGIILVFISVWLLLTPNQFISNLIDELDILGYDLQLRARVSTEGQPSLAPIAIIDVDEKSLQTIGRWPWQRSQLAKLIEKLHEDGASVIAFDMIFPEKEKNIAEEILQVLGKQNALNAQVSDVLNKNKFIFDEDEIFAKSIKTIQPVLSLGFFSFAKSNNVLPDPIITLPAKENAKLAILPVKGYVGNIPVLQNAANYSGFINIYPDFDGIIRRVPMIVNYKGGIYPSLALQAVMVYLGKNISLFTPLYNKQKRLEGIQLGPHLIPTDKSGKALIPFIGRSYTFPYYSASDVIEDTIPKNVLKDKIVFIGTSALGLGDLQPTAIQSPYPGVEMHATIANGILKDNFSSIPEWTRGAELFLTILCGMIAALVFPYLGPRMLALVIVLAPPGLLVINHWIWDKTGVVISFIIPFFVILFICLFNMIYGYLFETRKREQLKSIFGQYVPEKHIERMLTNVDSSYGFALKGESRDLTVLFADIRNFTMISENMPANELVDLLNTLFTPMTEIIFKHRGTIDKYVGDLIMAFWGAPLNDRKHAEHAIAAALEMQKKMKALRKIASKHHWGELNMGIGINSGVMSVGDMGSRYRRNYTVLGDAVNLASRVESLIKFYKVNIIVTEYTQANQTKFVFRKLDKVRVKGKTQVISIYEVICSLKELNPELAQELEKYHTALNFYYQQQWDEALNLMMELHGAFPHTKIYQIYIDRIKEFQQEPLPENWDGTYIHHHK